MARCIEEGQQYKHPTSGSSVRLIPPGASTTDDGEDNCSSHLHDDINQEPSTCNCCTVFAATVTDPLSSLPVPSLLHRCFTAWRTGTDFPLQCSIPLDPELARNWLKAAQNSDEHCGKLRTLIGRGLSKFRIDENGLLRIRDKYVLPKRYGRSLAQYVHHSYGHCGVKQTLKIICRDFFCLRIADTVQRVVGKCYCQYVRARRGPL
ncbi:hypothetical protein Pmar_PMAR022405 [Perkinsus marinus ATCC 50983]|uniref:Integrase zinc-binding domain-containing protein n=1 Tax=Perkinsus marinus (strain ATCC 50983 / TXsc) TaxID=423536 RepID=C5KXY4_PERM5|nr:hypothetical protein Pmar_PMAR022405 [Perkinsus marinus ATCC 50983]EER10659.1 hypothetical protein Pmar_PMAR022405 [Perkinsus marinus ATCC 50983]|eukprot:XP_002778864.1 hypothetical protein Pmar_PMAR022405 [Perkinsus marinus ATCC 50983]